MTTKQAARRERQLEIRRAMLCAKHGHPRVADFCFGYVTCARCGAQLGDTLTAVFELQYYVIVGHDCEVCRGNAKTLKRHERFLLPPDAQKAVGAR